MNYQYNYGSYEPNHYGSYDPKPPKKSGDFSKIFLTVLLCVSLSFCTAVGGVIFAKQNLVNESTTKQGINPPPSDSSLHNSNPSEIIDRSDVEYSPYGSAGDDPFAISEVVRMVESSVVVINAMITTTNSFGFASESPSAGSGVIIHSDGYILTCNHVVEGAASGKITVTLNDGVSQYSAALVGQDSASDLAVLKIQPKADQPLTSAKHGKSGYLVVGERVVAIGNPLGTLGGTVTDGIISATERRIETENGTMTLLQTNAAINSGNSGGGLFNLKGELIGIVNAKYAASGVEGLAFAIPIDSAYEVEQDLIQFGYVRGIVDHGMSLLEINQSNLYYYQRYNIKTVGLYVISSSINTDLKNKDRIVSINGKNITAEADFDAVMANCKVGDTITVVYEREDKTYETTITLEEYVPNGNINFQK